ncbi:MAG: hypothetical protein IJO40_04635 [Thermoguttaceae bacterium]|nr:hypothetical protein [Thermoguttaceae bacterium]
MTSEFIFIYPKRRLDAAGARRVFFARRGRVPSPSEARVEPCSETLNWLRITPLSSGSGSFYAPCVSKREGLVFASTGTLAPSSEPRSLFLELARGQLGRLLRKRCEWGALGLEIPKTLTSATRRDLRRFAELATSDRSAAGFEDECAALFDSLRETCLRTNDVFLEQATAARRDGASERPTALGFSAGASAFAGEKTPFSGPSGASRRRLRSSFNVFNPSISWADVERREGAFDWSAFDRALAFGEKRGWRTTFGPLTRWTARTVPRWVVGRSDAEVAEAFWRFVEAAVLRAGLRVGRWIVATNVERSDWGPTAETRFAATEEAARRIRRLVSGAEAFWGFERPFGDAERFDAASAGAPFEIAWRLLGRGAFDGVYLEANFGLSRWATAPRDPFEWHRLFDRWATLGVPICVAASFPSANPRKRVATLFSASAENSWGRWFAWGKRDDGGVDFDGLLTAPPELEIEESFWSERTQQENARRFFLTAIARRSVVEAIWSRWEDGDDGGSVDADWETPDETTRDGTDGERRGAQETTRAEKDEFPTSGLFDETGRPKPALHKLAALKRAYLG